MTNTHTATIQLSPFEAISGDAATVMLVAFVHIAPMLAPGYYR